MIGPRGDVEAWLSAWHAESPGGAQVAHHMWVELAFRAAGFLDCHSSRAPTRPIRTAPALKTRCDSGAPCPVETRRLAAPSDSLGPELSSRFCRVLHGRERQGPGLAGWLQSCKRRVRCCTRCASQWKKAWPSILHDASLKGHVLPAVAPSPLRVERRVWNRAFAAPGQ